MSNEVRRSQRTRNETTRKALLTEARRQFVKHGFANASTNEIVERAGVTRGALYHHFDSKEALFLDVVRAEASAVAAQIENGADGASDATSALERGALAYMDAMSAKDRTQLLLVAAPAVLGSDAMRQIESANAENVLERGLLDVGVEQQVATPLTELLSAAFDRAALAVADGGDATAVRSAVVYLIRRIAV